MVAPDSLILSVLLTDEIPFRMEAFSEELSPVIAPPVTLSTDFEIESNIFPDLSQKTKTKTAMTTRLNTQHPQLDVRPAGVAGGLGFWVGVIFAGTAWADADPWVDEVLADTGFEAVIFGTNAAADRSGAFFFGKILT